MGPVLLFLGLQLLTLVAFSAPERQYLFFWYCNNVLVLLAIAFYYNNIQLVKGLSYVGVLTQLYWLLDFVFNLLGFHLSGTTDFVFTESHLLSTIATVIVHVVSPLAVLALTARVMPRPVSLLYAWGYTVALFVVTLFFTTPGRDINCVFSACSPTAWYGWWDPYLWPVALLGMTVIAYGLHYGLYRLVSAPSRAR